MPRELSDLAPYFLQYRLDKNISRREEQTTKVVIGRLMVKIRIWWAKMFLKGYPLEAKTAPKK